MPAVEYTKSFITSVVVGKDVVPRIGLHQLESLRADLINTIKRSKDPKVHAISQSNTIYHVSQASWHIFNN
jgi:sn1-specific diacylglycerol lipase